MRIGNGIGDLYGRTFLPPIRDIGLEQRKVAVLRIAVGLIAFTRTGLITEGSRYFFYYPGQHSVPPQTVRGILMLIAIAAMTVGFLTPLSTALVLTLYPHFDEIMLTSTLGTYMLLILLLFLLCVHSGASLSVDRVLAMRYRYAGAPSRWSAALFGKPSVRGFEASYLLLFASYALINCGAVLYHWEDEFWATGQAVGVMETSAFSSRFYGFFRWQEIHIHWLFKMMSLLAGSITEFWQFFMVPLMFTKIGRNFVVFWGFTFALVSAIFFDLSYLPYLELCVLLALFLKAQRTHVADLYYDDGCLGCRRLVRFLSWVNLPKALEFKPLSAHLDEARAHGISDNDLRVRSHAVYRGRVYSGYDIWPLVTRITPLVVLYPEALLARWLTIGPRLYERFIASRPHVSRPRSAAGSRNAWSLHSPRRSWLSIGAAVIAVWAAAVLLYSFELSRIVFPATDKPGYVVNSWTVQQLRRFGLVVPIVFDYKDLRYSERWAVIYRVDPDGRRHEIPYQGMDGQRLSYFLEDQILYAISVIWHYQIVDFTDQQYLNFNRPRGGGLSLLQVVARYDYRRKGFTGKHGYVIRLYENRAIDLSISPRARYRPQFVGATSFTMCLPPGSATCAS